MTPSELDHAWKLMKLVAESPEIMIRAKARSTGTKSEFRSKTITWNWYDNHYEEPTVPRDIWVNEYNDRIVNAYSSKKVSVEMSEQSHGLTRTAVHYREVTDD